MKYEKEIEIEFTPSEIVDELWDMDAFRQAEVLLCLAYIYQANYADFCMQLEYICTDLKRDYNEAERELIIDMIKEIHEYVAYREDGE